MGFKEQEILAADPRGITGEGFTVTLPRLHTSAGRDKCKNQLGGRHPFRDGGFVQPPQQGEIKTHQITELLITYIAPVALAMLENKRKPY